MGLMGRMGRIKPGKRLWLRGLRKAVFCVAKHGLSGEDMPPFTMQKAAFCQRDGFITYFRPPRMYTPGAAGRATRTPCSVYQALSRDDGQPSASTPAMPDGAEDDSEARHMSP